MAPYGAAAALGSAARLARGAWFVVQVLIQPLLRRAESVLGKMAGRSGTALYYYLVLILHLVLLTECNYGVRHGDRAKRLHVAEYGDPPHRKPLVIDRRGAEPRGQDDGDGETSFGRTRRDAPSPDHPHNNPNITTKV